MVKAPNACAVEHCRKPAGNIGPSQPNGIKKPRNNAASAAKKKAETVAQRGRCVRLTALFGLSFRLHRLHSTLCNVQWLVIVVSRPSCSGQQALSGDARSPSLSARRTLACDFLQEPGWNARRTYSPYKS